MTGRRHGVRRGPAAIVPLAEKNCFRPATALAEVMIRGIYFMQRTPVGAAARRLYFLPQGETDTMNRQSIRRMISADLQNLLEILTTRQHVHPHESVRVVLNQTVQELGVCPNAIEQALQWLQVDGSRSIGRLRRTELMQLARTVHRFWRHPAAETVRSPQA
jgi:hypothetical protein